MICMIWMGEREKATDFEMEDSDVLESREDLGEWRHMVGRMVMCWE